MNKSRLRHSVFTIILGLALFPGILHAQTLTDTKYVQPSVTKTTYQGYFSYDANICTYSMSGIYQGCPIQSTNWQICGCEWTGYSTCPSQYIKCLSTVSNFDDYFDYGIIKPVSTSPTNFVLQTVASQWIDLAPACPELALATSTYSCSSQTSTCTPVQWFLDCDKDGVGDGNLVTAITSCTKPTDKGTCGYATAKIDSCDFTPGVMTKSTLCKDGDGDGYPSSITALTCPGPGYLKCPGEAGGQVGDCDDANATVGDKQQYCADQDGDGYCCANPDKNGYCGKEPNILAVQTFCPKAVLPSYIPLAATKGPDACDQVKGMTVEIEECMDNDGDSFGNPNMCEKHCFYGPFDSWEPKSSGVECSPDATHTVPDEDPSFNPKQKWVLDCDGDGYYPENLVKTGCTQPQQPIDCKYIKAEEGAKPIQNYVLLESPEGKTLKPGDCADTWFKMHAQTTWVTDSDADGYYDISKSIVQCKDPDEVENQVYPHCAESADPDCAAKAKASPYKMLSKVTWKAGDCDDTDPVILDILWQFVDWDMDGRGDPLSSTVTHCADTATSDIPTTTTTPAYGETGVQYPMAKHPDDLTPNGEPLTSKIFFVTQTMPVPCEEQFKQGKTVCLVPGGICRYKPSPLFPDLSCLSEAFRSKYCPTFGTLYDGSDQPFTDLNDQEGLAGGDPPAYSIDLSSLFQSGQIPFGTTRPILTEQQFSELAIMPTEINTSDLWPYYACLYLDSFKKTSFLGGWLEVAASPMGGWVSFPATTWAVLKLNPGSGQDPATSPQVFSLLAASGIDYTLALDALAKPGYEKWNVPLAALLPKATVAEVEIPAFPTITTLDQLLQTTKNLGHMPYPIPVIVKSGPKAGTIQCVYYGEMYGYQTQCKFGHLSDPRHAPKLADLLAQKGVLPEEAANLTDSDGDKVTDVAEVNLPFLDVGMGAGFAQQIAMDATIKPVATGPSFENIILNVNLTPDEVALLNEAKKRALDILPVVFERIQEVVSDYPDTGMTLTLPEWNVRVQYAVARWVWGPPSFYNGTNYAANWGLSYLALPTTALELVPSSKNAAGAPIVNLWLIQKHAQQQGLDPVQAIANAMIRTISRDHVVMDAKLTPLKESLIKSILEGWGGEVYIPDTPEILP